MIDLEIKCENCGEINDISKWTEWLRQKVSKGELFVYRTPTSDDMTYPRCTNCHVEFPFAKQSSLVR